ncbi:MAG: TraR/DksA family transcriptional regulator [Spirochaetia bacterium]
MDEQFTEQMKHRLEEARDSYRRSLDMRKEDFDEMNLDDSVVDPTGWGERLDQVDRLGLLEVQDRERLRLIVSALAKIRDGSYGICETCGAHIDKGRLEAKPEAHYCLSCEKRH